MDDQLYKRILQDVSELQAEVRANERENRKRLENIVDKIHNIELELAAMPKNGNKPLPKNIKPTPTVLAALVSVISGLLWLLKIVIERVFT